MDKINYQFVLDSLGQMRNELQMKIETYKRFLDEQTGYLGQYRESH